MRSSALWCCLPIAPLRNGRRKRIRIRTRCVSSSAASGSRACWGCYPIRSRSSSRAGRHGCRTPSGGRLIGTKPSMTGSTIWWSILILEGYSRTILAGAIAPTEATWVALMVLYTACLRYGVPEALISDSGGAYISNDFDAVCTRLQLQHETIESTKGKSYQNLVETHFNIQRRLYDYQFSLTTTPLELEQRHQAFIQTYSTTTHQGLLKEQFTPPIPLKVLGAAKGRVYTEEELSRKFDHHLF